MRKAEAMMNKTAIALLSGGLDSVVSLFVALKNNIDVKLALTFDYGQKAFKEELLAAQTIAEKYGIEHKVIKLDFLKELLVSVDIHSEYPTKHRPVSFLPPASSAAVGELTSGGAVPPIKHKSCVADCQHSLNDWVPNRNALFLNIAGAYCDASGYDFIIFGANAQEAEDFPDNSSEFIKRADAVFEYSTQKRPKVYAPLCDLTKVEIINLAIKENIDISMIKSCYNERMRGKKKCIFSFLSERIKRRKPHNGMNEGRENEVLTSGASELNGQSPYNKTSEGSHCGECASCKALYDAILKSDNRGLLKQFF